ncbi:MAG: response regulator [Kiritimatiellia bacterium]
MNKILSIDDEPAMLRCLQGVLEHEGYKLAVTSDPEEGLRILREDESICLALLDIRMPGKNGFEIYREMRKFRKVPVLFVTAYPKSFNSKSDHIVRMWKEEFADGTTDILYKPFNAATLVEKVEGLIGSPEKDSGGSE